MGLPPGRWSCCSIATPRRPRKLAELKELQKDALAEMRTLIFELRPQGLETDGLAQALRNHGAAVQGRTGLAVSVEVESEERLPLDIEEAFYRVAQEALHNVVKHANAHTARIELRRTGRKVRLTVEDDGTGFDPAEIARGHLGLIGMQQRAERIGAELEVGHRPGNGTRRAHDAAARGDRNRRFAVLADGARRRNDVPGHRPFRRRRFSNAVVGSFHVQPRRAGVG